MGEPLPHNTSDIAKALIEILPRLADRVRADIPRDTNEIAPEWRDVLELRATKGQIKLLRVLMVRQCCTMQQLAEQLDVAPPTVTVMVKRLLSQGFVERVRDEQDWRVVQVSPTDRGRRAASLYEEFWHTNLQRLLTHLSEDELEMLRVALPVLHHISEI